MEKVNDLRSQYFKSVREYRYAQSRRFALLEYFNAQRPDLAVSQFKKLNYEQLYKAGTYRIIDGKQKRYKGAAAIRMQIKSLHAQTSQIAQKSLFIKNYLQAMTKAGYNNNEVDLIRKTLNTFSNDQLAVAYSLGTLPSIQVIYSYKRLGLRPVEELNQAILASKIKITKQDRVEINKIAQGYNIIFKRRISAQTKNEYENKPKK